MNSSSRPAWRAALLGVALSVLLVLLLAPPTGWLARAQWAAVGFHVPQSDAQKNADYLTRRVQAARQFSNDADAQIAAALDKAGGQAAQTMETTGSYSAPDTSTLRQEALRALLPRFGGSPVVYATLVRFQTEGDDRHRVRISRHEEDLLSSQPPPPTPPSPAPPSKSLPPDPPPRPPTDPAVLAAFDADCAAGERLDPHNGFFPMMRAAGLFAARKDKDAVNAVLRAGARPVWNDYTRNELNGHGRLAEAADGPQSVLNRDGIAAAILLPHFAPVRAVTRLATGKAMRMEMAGNVEQGLAIRHALMNVGDRMRVQSNFYIGSLVGMAIAAIATARPGGAAPLPSSIDDASYWARTDKRVAQFAAFATRNGQPELGNFARAQAAADEATHAVWTKAAPRAVFSRLLPQGALWIAGELTLSVVLWYLVLGGAARLLARRAAFREARPLPRSVAWGMAIAVLVFCAIASYNNTEDTSLQVSIVGAVAVGIVIGLGTLFLLRRNLTRPALGRFVRTFALTALVLAGVGLLFHAQDDRVRQQLQGLWALSLDENNNAGQGWRPYLETLLAGAVTLALPFLMATAFAVAGRARRVPVSVAIVRGFLLSSVPAACILILLWGGLTLYTVRQERALNAELNQMTAHEGHYMARLAGTNWPGPVVR